MNCSSSSKWYAADTPAYTVHTTITINSCWQEPLRRHTEQSVHRHSAAGSFVPGQLMWFSSSIVLNSCR
jgi:hypothetical protein